MGFIPHFKSVTRFLRQAILFSTSLFLTACTTVAVQQTEELPVITQEEVALTPVEEVEPLPLTSELVYYLLTAEIAGQRGEMGTAIELYHKASTVIDSSAVASRSAEVALFSRDEQRIERALKRWTEVDPDDAEVYITHAPFLMLKNDYDGVVSAVNSALRLSPENAKEYLARVSDHLVELASPEKGLSVIKRLNTYKSNELEALFAYSRLAAYAQKNDEALLVINKVLKQDSNREDALVLKAEILQNLDKGNEALAVLKKAANQKDASDSVRFSYAKLLGQNNQTAQSRAKFKQLHTEHPENEEVIFALGLLAMEERDGQLAKTYFSKLIALGDSGKQAAYFMGLSEEINEDMKAALIWYASVPVDSQKFQSAQTRYVNVLADNGEIDKARLHLKLLRKEQPDQAIQYYIFEAEFLIGRDKLQAAFDLYGEALKEHPGNIDLLHARAAVAEPLNHLDVLEKDLNEILAKDPDNHRALNALGYTLTDRTTRHDEALILINKALKLSPNDPFYLDSLGWVYYRLGDLEKAEVYLRQAAVLLPQAEMMAHLGEVLWKQGKKEEAKQVWQQGLDKDETNELLNETKRRFGL